MNQQPNPSDGKPHSDQSQPDQPQNTQPQADHPLLTISDLAAELDISTRTIRYYEELGLLRPVRSEKGNRLYTRSDRARLKLILRGKRFGFSLDEIKEMIELFHEDRTGRKQLERTISYGNQKLQEIDERIQELKLLREEILQFKEKFEQRWHELESESVESESDS
ncbi:MerR family transcriptional regulator [Brevibacillus dissolubilis]|uniref:MerR family transcriptional regulator n=1 Tax=Brevibacillus dissolubilis TaxID=1844116 RepID=UPI0011172BA5|nr:MerR family DNA-binding transcriptional regulator [Brevibacillus dissolubilis]